MQGFKSLVWLLVLGEIADADVTFTLLIEEGDDSGLSDAAAVADAQLDPTELVARPLFSDDDTIRKIGYVGEKRFVRLTLTPAANTGNMFIAVVAILGDADQRPTTAQAA